MTAIVKALKTYLTREITAAFLGVSQKSSGAQLDSLRLSFSGPPEELLAELFEALSTSDGKIILCDGNYEITVPVFLVDPNAVDPATECQSSRCTASYLITVRNHGYRCLLVLYGRDEEINQSLATAIKPLGLSQSQPDLDRWMAEPLITYLLEEALGGLLGPDRPPLAMACVKHALQECWETDQRYRDKRNSWAIIQSLYAAGAQGLTGSNAFLSSLGLPACGAKKIGNEEHLSTLTNVASLLESNGFTLGFEELESNAVEEPEIVAALRGFRDHLRSAGVLDAGAFAKAPQRFYAPPINSGAEPPDWWRLLTTECWASLLTTNTPASGKLQVRIDPTIAGPYRGMPELTLGSVGLVLSVGESSQGGQVEVSRAAGNAQYKLMATLFVPPDEMVSWVDETIPMHDRFLRYKVESSGYSSVIVKAIELGQYSPGVVAVARNAKSIKPFRLNRKAKDASNRTVERWECDFILSGTGQHTVDLFVGPSSLISSTVTCYDSSADNPEPLDRPINQSDSSRWTCLIETDEESYFDFSATNRKTAQKTLFRVHVTAEEVDPTEVNSHFQRLVLENRSVVADDYARTKVEPRRCRSADLEEFALEDVQSFRPVILGPDFLEAWKKPDWEKKPLLSLLGLPVDPRPSSIEMTPPKNFLEARETLLRLLRPEGDQNAPSCAGMWRLFQLMRQEEFRQAVHRLLKAYLLWLETNYDVAVWSDVYAIHAKQPGVAALESGPYAVLLSPLHPIRLSWQCHAQSLLQGAIDSNKPCPAASTANPAFFPDCLLLSCQSGSGSILRKQFAAMASSSDYWGVHWSVDAMARLGRGAEDPVFCREFGISVDGLSAGFTSAQVVRSLDEATRLLSGRTTLSVNLCADTVGHTSLNEGIEYWCNSKIGPDNDCWAGSGEFCLKINDQRLGAMQPEQAVLASLAARTEAAVRWFDVSTSKNVTGQDLSIVAHLGTINHEFSLQGLVSAIDYSALARWRVRKQVPGHNTIFIAESRVAGKPASLDQESLAGALLSCVDYLESKCRHLFDSYVFAPNMALLKSAIESAAFCAVSSSGIDAACFFGNGQNSYLWDYELPSYARRAGENSGYFLLAKQSESMDEAIRSAVTALGGVIPDNTVKDLLDEIARRGMPTLKRLTAGGAISLGELGGLIALRMLQSEFQKYQSPTGLLPVLYNGNTLNLVVPADPFAYHFDDLRKGPLGIGSAERPDILILSLFYMDGRAVSLKITPIEIKVRTGQMSASDKKASLGQAKAFSIFLEKLQAASEATDLWGFAYRGLVASLLDYGFRVYGQLPNFLQTGDWAERHSAALCSLGNNDLDVKIDGRGRLVLVEGSGNSRPEDLDGDGFKESVVLSHSDAINMLIRGETNLLKNIFQTIGHWDLMSNQGSSDRVMPVLVNPVSSSKHTAATTVPPIPIVTVEGHSTVEISLNSNGAETEPPHTLVVPQADGDHPEASDDQNPASGSETAPVQHKWIHFDVGKTIHGFTNAAIAFNPGITSLNHLNIGIVGDLGTGKTQLVQSLLSQMRHNPSDNRGSPPNVLIFDYKRDYSKPDFVQKTGARVVKPNQLPLNLFDVSGGVVGGNVWLERSRFFCDVLEKLYPGIGPKQRQKIKTAVKDAYSGALSSGKASPTLNDVFRAYTVENDIDSPYSIMSDLVDGEYFVSSSDATVPFRDFMSGIVVVDLASVGQDDRTKNMLVVIFLNLFYEHMLQIDKKPFLGTSPQTRFIDTMVLVDEADNIMKFEFDVLKKVLLQGREFGVGVLLASQYLSHFRTTHENYAEPLLTWFVHKVPNLSVRDLEGIGITGASVETVNMVKSLKPHECLYKTAGIDCKFIRGTPFYELTAHTGPCQSE